MTETKKRIGRPPKGAVAAKKKGQRGKVGRPAGDKAIMDEYKARMLNSPKSRKVIDSIFNAALNDEHKNQAAAWKLLADRLIPVSLFEQQAGVKHSAPQVVVNVTGIGAPQGTTIDGDAVDIDFEDAGEAGE